MKRNILISVLILLFSIFVYAGCENEEKIDQATALQKLAKIGPEQAQKLALKQAAGKIVSSELEVENGLLIYSYDIKTSDNRAMEVQINAKDGSVVSTVEENPEKERISEEKETAEQEKGKQEETENEYQKEAGQREIGENVEKEKHEYEQEKKGEHEKEGETAEEKGQQHEIVGTIAVTGEKDLQPLAKIDKQQARTAALKLVEGKAEKVELENEDGYLVYKVEVEFQEIDYEVLVDGGTGKVLAIEVE